MEVQSYRDLPFENREPLVITIARTLSTPDLKVDVASDEADRTIAVTNIDHHLGDRCVP